MGPPVSGAIYSVGRNIVDVRGFDIHMIFIDDVMIRKEALFFMGCRQTTKLLYCKLISTPHKTNAVERICPVISP